METLWFLCMDDKKTHSRSRILEHVENLTHEIVFYYYIYRNYYSTISSVLTNKKDIGK